MQKKVLIVDDEKSLVSVLVDRFTKENFKVFSAANGKLGLASAIKNHPDVIILDILMPVMDGVEMLKKLRESVWGKKVHVILLTNLPNTEKVDESFHYGACDYLIKCDMTIEDVVNKVKDKLQME